MDIRRATIDDVPDLTRMGRAFLAASPHAAVLGPGSDADVRRAMHALVTDEDGVVLVAQHSDGRIVGMICGTKGTVWFAPQHRIASELAWWVDAPSRGTRAALALLCRWLEIVREIGYEFASVSTLSADGSGTGSRMLTRCGFVPLETGWLVRLQEGEG